MNKYFYTTKENAEEMLEKWVNSEDPKNLRIRKEGKDLYLITEE